MDKKQALAAMDAHLVRVEAERKRHLERRQRYMLKLYPVLRRAPLEQRFDLFSEARRYAFRQWSPYAALGVFILGAGYLVRDQLMGITQDVPTSTLLIGIALAIVPACLLFLHIRAYLRLRIDIQAQDHERVLTQRGA